MANDLCIRLVGLIVRHDVQRKAGFRHAVVDNLLLNVAFNALAGIRRSQNGRETLINSRAVIQGNRFICSSFFSVCRIILAGFA
jgi:hypothetical protein